MARQASGILSGDVQTPEKIPPLEPGDRLTRPEFERRYAAMPQLPKAELIEGIVHMPSPVRFWRHGRPHAHLVTWFGLYEAGTPGVATGDHSTTRLDMDNEPQPDVVLLIDLNTTALLRGDLAGVLATVQQGLASPEHAAFVVRLAS